jgi:hypothetical protein
MQLRTLAIGVVVGCLLLSSSPHSQSPDPWIGTWKLNTAKSKYSPGLTPRSSTLVSVAVDGGFQQTVDTVMATLGMKTHSEVTAKFDGKDTRVKGNVNADTSAYTKIDSRSYEVVSKKNGKVTITSRVVISADGKTRTVTQTGTDAEGKKVNNLIVYDRQ